MADANIQGESARTNPIARRTLLASVPAIAAVVIAPAAYGSTPAAATDQAGWEDIKSKYALAHKRLYRASERADEADLALSHDDAAAPAAVVTSTKEDVEIGPVTVKAQSDALWLTPKNYRSELMAKGLKQIAEYAAYCRAVEAWEARPERVAMAQRCRKAEEELEKTNNAHVAAWHAVAAFPVADAITLADKVAVLRPEALDNGEWLGVLADSVSRDLARINRRV